MRPFVCSGLLVLYIDGTGAKIDFLDGNDFVALGVMRLVPVSSISVLISKLVARERCSFVLDFHSN